MFKGIMIEKDDAGYRAALTDIDESRLPEGDVTVRVSHSSLNYKDGLAITGKGPVVRKFPMVPGIDLVGTVEETSRSDYRIGDTRYSAHQGYGLDLCARVRLLSCRFR